MSRRTWLKAHPIVSDALVALALTVSGVWQILDAGTVRSGHTSPDRLNLTVLLVIMAMLPLRRRLPFTVLLVAIGGNALLTAFGHVPTVAEMLAFLVVVYTVAAHRALAVSCAGGGLAVVAFTMMSLRLPLGEARTFAGFTVNTALIVGVWWLGCSMRLRRSYEAELTHRAERLERARDVDARAARVEERSRIARELHDVVAHHVSVMTVQAGAARRIIDKDPETARAAMSTIEETGRSALREMRRIVGVLRTDRDAEQGAAALAPQPGIPDVGELIDHVRETGLSVRLSIEGEPRPLPPGVSIAAYRLIQEALTNTLKHAGPQARACVRIHYAPGELAVRVEDDGRGLAVLAGTKEGSGHGMVGMHERVALYGGQLRIGPRVGGGFEVRARFPVD